MLKLDSFQKDKGMRRIKRVLLRVMIILKLSVRMGVYIRFRLLIIILEDILVSLGAGDPDLLAKAMNIFGVCLKIKLISLSSVEELKK